MTIINCRECGEKFTQKWRLLRHHKEEHGGVIETPEEYLPDDNHEQRDFAGETPSSGEHNPEFEATNEPPETERTSLREYAEEEEEEDDE